MKFQLEINTDSNVFETVGLVESILESGTIVLLKSDTLMGVHCQLVGELKQKVQFRK